MSDIDKQSKTGHGAPDTSKAMDQQVKSPSRRRWVKLGTAAIPAVATLASRPALAWHCKTPSAWGSEIINPNTSLRTNGAHQSYPDETWYISNWADNTARSGVSWLTIKPWSRFFTLYPAIQTAASNNSNNVTIAMLGSIGIHVAGATSTAKVRVVLGTGAGSGTPFQKAVITAQLNFKAVSGYAQNEMESCLAFENLNTMAAGSYSPPGLGVNWYQSEIIQYLRENYFAL
jgi:hypothetical protein